MLGRLAAILYGSYARGDFNLWSDADVIVVSEVFEGVRPLDRWRLLEATRPPSLLEPIPWTPGEARRMLGKPSWRHAMEQGCVVVLDDYGVAPPECKPLARLVEEMERVARRLSGR